VDIAKTTRLSHLTTAASNVTPFGNYMAALFASVKG
jgi:hypothetical protein